MSGRVLVVGVGMTPFVKPGRGDGDDYPQMAKVAVQHALADAGLPFDAVQQAVVGYCYGDSTAGQRAVYESGCTGIPIVNVNNNCATGSSALFLAKQLVQGGVADCVLALGFEKMERGSLGAKFTDRTNPLGEHFGTMVQLCGLDAKAPGAPQLFGNAGLEHMKKYGTTLEQFAKIAVKNHRNSANNPYSQFQDVYSLEQILASPKVFGPLTKLQCCPTSDGAAAAILCSERFCYRYGLQNTAVEILGMQMTTDFPSSFDSKSMIKCVGSDMTRKAADDAYRQAGVRPEDVQVIELHDCFTCNELITYEALGLCPEGQGGQLVDRGDVDYGGKWVVNPSGGLISKGHPLGATGLAQCAELCWQLRGMAEKRQVKDAKIALQHNLGLGGAAVVTIYRKYQGETDSKPLQQTSSLGKAPALKVGEASPRSEGASESAENETQTIFAAMEKRMKENAGLAAKVGASYVFNIGDGASKQSWFVDFKQSPPVFQSGKSSAKMAADCSIDVKASDFSKMMTGKLNPQMAFMQGKLKVKGNMLLAQKLEVLVQSKAAL